MSLFSFFKRSQNDPTPNDAPTEKPKGLAAGLSRSRYRISQQLRSLMQGDTITKKHWDQMTDLLLLSDAGLETATWLTERARWYCERHNIHNPERLTEALREVCTELLIPCQMDDLIDSKQKPHTVLLVGINGSGKTTTAAKLAHRYSQKHSVMLAAGDTFRAAAIEQLKIWGERQGIPVIAQQTGSDSAAVIFDAVQSARAKNTDVLIADTAGRLHNADNLLDELKKVKRVLQKVDATLPQKTYLVLDGNLGQSSLNQALAFDEAIGIDGLIMTKLDGTAKGGALLAMAHRLKKPIVYLGMGEGAEDLLPFDATAFVAHLLDAS